mmetsp:Transcript_39007/g.124149  ORF Transcript_39007/g.124149 Transcript_39007/m.124149 type:complete len:256 (+) Transcript_39007:2635-3402(+)
MPLQGHRRTPRGVEPPRAPGLGLVRRPPGLLELRPDAVIEVILHGGGPRTQEPLDRGGVHHHAPVLHCRPRGVELHEAHDGVAAREGGEPEDKVLDLDVAGVVLLCEVVELVRGLGGEGLREEREEAGLAAPADQVLGTQAPPSSRRPPGEVACGVLEARVVVEHDLVDGAGLHEARDRSEVPGEDVHTKHEGSLLLRAPRLAPICLSRHGDGDSSIRELRGGDVSGRSDPLQLLEVCHVYVNFGLSRPWRDLHC